MRQTSSHIKRTTVSAALLAALCGCSGNLETVGGGGRPLGFDARMEETKATLKTSFVSGDKFKVWAKKSGESTRLFDGTTVSYNGTAWSYSGTAPLWKPDQTITFVAHSPETLTGNVTPNANGIAISGYTLSQDQELLLGYYSGTGNEGKAPVVFKHALASLEFKLGEDAPGWVTGITKISVTAPSKGNCNADFSPGTSIVWSSQSTNATVEQSLSGQSKASGAVIGTPFLELPKDGGSFTVSVNVHSWAGIKTFSLTKSGVTLAPGKKYVYSVCLPKEIGMGTISVDEWTTIPSDTPITVEELSGVLPGEFTINADGKKVHFSTGNLVATINATATPIDWKFAENQYDYLGEGGVNQTFGHVAGDFDLFGKPASKDGSISSYNNYGISDSFSNSYYDGDFYDWGKLVGYGGNTWRTLTRDEWRYLCRTRTMTNGKDRYSVEMSGVTIEEAIYKGVFLYPDDYNGNVVSNGSMTWEQINATGIVFLPAAGARLDDVVSGVGDKVVYRSYSPEDGFSYELTLNEDGGLIFPLISDYYGCSVRLVTDSK